MENKPPTLKDGQTIDKILNNFGKSSYDFGAMHMSDFASAMEHKEELHQKAKQAIEAYCAEREYKNYLRGMLHAYEAIPSIISKDTIDPSSLLNYYKEKERNLRTKLSNLQAQSGSQEADENS